MNHKPAARRNRTLKTSRSIGSLSLILICLFSNALAQSENPTPTIDLDVSKWIAESLLKTRQTNLRLVSDYSYKMRRTNTRRDGKINTSLSEAYFPSRLKNKTRTKGVIILLEENGVRLPEKKIEKQRREAAEKLEEMGNASEQETSALEEKREKGVSLDWTYQVAVDLSSFLRVCQFHTPRKQIVDGRETLILNFNRCDPGKLPENKSYLANLQGTVWFDVSDKAPIRLEAWEKTLTAAPPKVPLLFAQQRVAESTWLPALIRVEGIGNEAFMSNLKINWQIEFFDYKLSQIEIKDVIIDSK
jgi:hypothetical protein